jgi:hypothetical protein
MVGATGKDVDPSVVHWSNQAPDYALQRTKIAAVFELLGSKFNSRVSGVQWSEYMPWSQAEWIQNPKHSVGWDFYYAQFRGFDLLNNESAQIQLSEYFSKPWGYTTVK